jgi:hypothetical protein
MKLSDIVDYRIDDGVKCEYKVYYARKDWKDDDGHLNFMVMDGVYPSDWTEKEVEEHARKEWSRRPHYGTIREQWDDPNYIFVVIAVYTVFKQWHELAKPWIEETK